MKLKQKQKVKIFMATSLLGVGVLVTVSPALVLADSTCAGVATSIISCSQTGDGTCPNNTANDTKVALTAKCQDGSTPIAETQDTGVWGLLILAINILTGAVGIAAIGGVVYGAVLYTTAGGSQEQVKKAIGILTNVAIGVVAYALMWALLNFLVPGGVFN